MKREFSILAAFLAVFLAAYHLPLADPKVKGAILEAFKLLQWYARHHTLTCVVPALFIAGGIITFLSQASVMRHLGPASNKLVAYTVASVSGTVLAVCSCSVLPMFAGIYRMGAGLGPATAFLYSGPAINVLALFLTARVLGLKIGLARALGSIAFALVVGLAMAAIFHRGERAKAQAAMQFAKPAGSRRMGWQTAATLACMLAFLVFSDWYNPGDAVVRKADGTAIRGVVLKETRDEVTIQVQDTTGEMRAGERLVLPKPEIDRIDEAQGWVMDVFRRRWTFAGLAGLAVALMAWRWYDRSEIRDWMRNTWYFAKMLLPLLFGGILLVGFIGELLPEKQIGQLVGDNTPRANLIASAVGALFYFATLTEIPIVQALTEHGMVQGPALALLLAGPVLSLPSILVIRAVMGTGKTAVFCGMVVLMSATVGILFGAVA